MAKKIGLEENQGAQINLKGDDMAIRTPEQYIESLKDDRVVWIEGEKVEDVTKHPHLRTCAETCAMDYVLCQDPRYKDLLIERDDKGEPYHYSFKPTQSSQDILRRRQAIQLGARTCFGFPAGAKFTGIDALHALTSVCRRMDKEIGSSYAPRVEAYRQICKDEDAAIAVAMTDVKGDRSLHPSKQKTHQDYYVRIVDETKEGIVVRGAKAHISLSPLSNEVIVLPCRAMREEDKDYAVAFAFSPNTKGVTFIAPCPEPIEEGNHFDYPITSHLYAADAMIIFDDVFIPMEKVFMKGEWQYAGPIAYMFANFHRLSADAYKVATLEILAGAAALMAEYNGLDRVPHIQEKLSWLMWYAESTDALGRVACLDCVIDPSSGVAYPNPMYSNASKFFFAENYHQALKQVIDIAGGIVVTIPSSKDYLNPQTHDLIDKYLGGKEGIPAEHRIRAIKLVKDLLGAWDQVTTIHAEGSLSAQKLSFFQLGDWERYKAAAKRVAGIEDEKKHPFFGELPKFPTWTWE